MARGQRGYGNGGRSAYSNGTPGAQSRAVFAAGAVSTFSYPPVNRLSLVPMRDELGNALVDELGNRIVGQDASGPTTIKGAAATRGMLYGITYRPEDNPSTAYKTALLSEAALLVPDFSAQSVVWHPTRTTFDFTRLQMLMDAAKTAGLPWRAPSGWIYCAHDMTWVSTNTANVISPVNDGTGQPAVRAATWQAIIDEMIAAYIAQIKPYPPISINMANEMVDPQQPDGLRPNPWNTATGGLGWLIYAYKAMRAALDANGMSSVKLFQCQDQLEQPNGSFGTNLQAAFVTKLLDVLIAGGAPIDGVDDQAHLTIAQGFDPVAYGALLDTIATRKNPVTNNNLTITLGEIDIKTGNSGNFTPANYSTPELDTQSAVIVSELLSVALPRVTGGAVISWTFSDATQSYGTGERPGLYDVNLAVKPQMYAAFREQLNWR